MYVHIYAHSEARTSAGKHVFDVIRTLWGRAAIVPTNHKQTMEASSTATLPNRSRP